MRASTDLTDLRALYRAIVDECGRLDPDSETVRVMLSAVGQLQGFDTIRMRVSDVADDLCGLQVPGKSTDEMLTVIERRVLGLRQALDVAQRELEAVKRENMCDACAGGHPISGVPCMCGGTGKMSDAAVVLRTMLIEAERHLEAERAKVERAWCDVADWLQHNLPQAAAMAHEVRTEARRRVKP